MPSDHMMVMELLHASHAAAGQPEPARRIDAPDCQVVSRAARADADEGGMRRVEFLAIGTAICAHDLTTVLAGHKNVSTEQLLDELSASHRNAGSDNPLLGLLRAIHAQDMQRMAELLVDLFGRDQGAFFDLIVELGRYAADCVSMLEILGISPVAETLTELEITVREYADS
ncbi:hypothetical protein GCM10017744_000760 [Streptomyces antimycoticus]|uniref:Uncharacterized protein n=1 Tax=Streptomyces antimycoticus TaxID=68175 RepID=A0A4D4KRE3_9ACTN|nr:hypothetical protein [Streptomyces antimycoticus]GDY49007.1 hypothetical protein SANT12839_098890 [Streptomyces antimycoticus]